MHKNMLKLNDDKTELLVIYPKLVDVTTLSCSVKVGDVHIQPSAYVRNLGVAFDCVMALDRHVQNICRAALIPSPQHQSRPSLS